MSYGAWLLAFDDTPTRRELAADEAGYLPPLGPPAGAPVPAFTTEEWRAAYVEMGIPWPENWPPQ